MIVGAGPSQSGCTLALNIGGKVFRASNKELVKGLIDSNSRQIKKYVALVKGNVNQLKNQERDNELAISPIPTFEGK